MRTMPRFFVLCSGLYLVANLCAQNTGETLEVRVKKLIQQLGSPEFTQREAAERELVKLGADTYDALEEAQLNADDLEIRMRSQYLLKRFRVTALETDPPTVKQLLKQYLDHKPTESAVDAITGEDGDPRTSLLHELARLPDCTGWPALIRLSRLEQDETLSKVAALAILQGERPETEQLPAALTALPGGETAAKRRAVEWLRIYGRSLRQPNALAPEWQPLVREEFAELEKKGRTTKEIALRFARWQVEELRRLKHSEAAAGLIGQITGLIAGFPESAVEQQVDWLAGLELWPEIVSAESKFAKAFSTRKVLAYRLAEAKLKLGETTTAAAQAEKALKTGADGYPDHILAGNSLAERGLFDWAEREYREVLKSTGKGTIYDIQVRSILAEMFHDQGRELAAAEVLQSLIDALETDANARRFFEQSNREVGSVKSRMHLFYAYDLLEKKDLAKAEQNLLQSYEDDHGNIDALIGLFRLPNPSEESRQRTKSLLQDATTTFQREIQNLQRDLAESDTPEQQYRSRLFLAKANNDFSWLVSNTEGDFEAAIRASHESLKLRPGTAAYMDTLGRAYYANGDLANAIKHQTAALKLEPHSGAMQRQLALFKNAAQNKLEKQPK